MKAGRPDDLGTYAVEQDAYTAALTAWADKQAAALVEGVGAKADDGPPDVGALWAEGTDERLAQLTAIVQAYGYRLAQVGAWAVLQEYNPDADGWDAAGMEAWLARAAQAHAEQYEQAGHDAAVKGAEDPAGWQSGVKAALAGWVTRAAVRAVTSGSEARGFGGYDAAGASGLTYKVWHTGGTSPRPSHKAMDGDRVELDDVFANGLRWPGDAHGKEAETANCKCHLSYEREE